MIVTATLLTVLAVVGGLIIVASANSKDDAAPFGCLFGLALIGAALMVAGFYHDQELPRARQYNARATIAAATAAVAGATAESELRALERAASGAATAAASEGVGR